MLAAAVSRLDVDFASTTDEKEEKQSPDDRTRANTAQLTALNNSMTDELKQTASGNLGKLEEKPFKIVIAGPSNTGKSSLAYYLQHGRPNSDLAPTHGANLTKLNWEFEAQRIQMELWDTTGQERQMNTITPFLRKIDAVLLVFDINQVTTLNELYRRLEHILSSSRGESLVIFLLGNKADIICPPEDPNHVSLSYLREAVAGLKDLIEQKRSKTGPPSVLSYFEVSAKTGYNCAEVCQQLQLQIAYRRIFGQALQNGGVDIRERKTNKNCC
jgi:small GTP-binding protein